MKYFNCSMTSSLFSSFQENTKCESLFFADTCTRRVPIFGIVLGIEPATFAFLERSSSILYAVCPTRPSHSIGQVGN